MTGIDRRLVAAGLAVAALTTTAAATAGRTAEAQTVANQTVANQTVANQTVANRAAATPTCPGWEVVAARNPGVVDTDLFGLAVLSAKNVWAAGDYLAANGNFHTLIEHWNGKTWQQVASPNPGAGWNELGGMTAISPTNIWAIGGYSTTSSSPLNITPDKTLIVHWNGHVWSQVRTPSPGSFIDELNGIAKVSASNIWVAGYYSQPNFAPDKSLILHWNGHQWSQLASPNVGKAGNTLGSVAAISAKSVWVTDGSSYTGTSSAGLLLHWNGRSWSTALKSAGDGYGAVSFSSAKNGWLVGGDKNGKSLTLHWNGRSWATVPAPSLKNLSNGLSSVTVLSPTSAWAVGSAFAVFNQDSTAIEEHWNGHKWSMMASPAPGGLSSLSAVQATPTTAPWAVGDYSTPGEVQRALVFRCR